ncbi:MAG: acetate--CoA ligase family protein [Candidatus Thermoplasmatota archaeon]|nr:acetate--CoA ligase family protein [Candidatus Thermoplasmatota archaeon]
MSTDPSKERSFTIVGNNAKNMLTRAGISVPKGMETKKLPAELGLSFPVALKVSDPRILHKTDVGGVKLNLGKEELKSEFSVMKKRFPDSSFLIEEMQQQGVEFIVGVLKDPSFGYVIMLGGGGIYTELYHDVTFRKLPISRVDAGEMLNDIREGMLCDGFRGIRINCEALKELLLSISRMIIDGADEILSMDLNPVIVSKDDAVVVDAKISINAKKADAPGKRE